MITASSSVDAAASVTAFAVEKQRPPLFKDVLRRKDPFGGAAAVVGLVQSGRVEVFPPVHEEILLLKVVIARLHLLRLLGGVQEHLPPVVVLVQLPQIPLALHLQVRAHVFEEVLLHGPGPRHLRTLRISVEETLSEVFEVIFLGKIPAFPLQLPLALDLKILAPVFKEIFRLRRLLGFPLPSAALVLLVKDVAPDHHEIFRLQSSTSLLRTFLGHQIVAPILEVVLLVENDFSVSHLLLGQVLSIFLALKDLPVGERLGGLLQVVPPLAEDVPVALDHRPLLAELGVALQNLAAVLENIRAVFKRHLVDDFAQPPRSDHVLVAADVPEDVVDVGVDSDV